MGAPYIPPPPPPPPPQQRTNTLLAVVIGILVVLVILVGFGLFVAGRFLSHTSIISSGEGANKTVDIKSPLGDLHVQGEGNDAKVEINSPFGSLRVDPTPDLARLDLGMVPGAVPVSHDDRDSPFFHYNRGDEDRDAGSLDDLALQHSAGAEVRLSSGGQALLITVAEFRTGETQDQVLAFYRQQLQRFGPVENGYSNRGRSLKVRLSHDDERSVTVRSRDGQTYFVLVRVQADSSAR